MMKMKFFGNELHSIRTLAYPKYKWERSLSLPTGDANNFAGVCITKTPTDSQLFVSSG
jgi:hypothetical protein